MSANKKEFSFIQEQIVPKKKNKLKRLGFTIIGVVLLGVLFGIVARITFMQSEKLVSKIFGNNKEPEKIVLNHPELIDLEENLAKLQEEAKKKEEEDAITKDSIEDIITKQRLDIGVEEYKAMYKEIKDVALEVNKSLVTVASVASGVDWFNNDYEITYNTPGLVLENTGSKLYILVNNSKMKDSNNIKVTFPIKGIAVPAVLHNYDSEIDLAILSVSVIDIPKEVLAEIKPAKLGETYSLSVGDPILALGSPDGHQGSVATGIVSNTDNSVYTIDNKLDLFYTDINYSANGEGVIANLKGEVVGIITAKYADELSTNVNTALSITRIKSTLEDLINKKERPCLGVIGADMSTEIATGYGLSYGVYVTKVEVNSPAFNVGIKSGDVILSVGEVNIVSTVALHNALSDYKSGETIKITLKNTARPDSPQRIEEVVLATK